MNIELHRLDIPRRLVNGIRRRVNSAKIESAFRARSHRADVAIPESSRAEVIVIGAGISGLATAYLLRQGGHRVTVLEAGAQIGGRADSVRSPFRSGLCADAGGFRFAADHYRVREYLNEFNLPYTNFYNTQGDMLVYLGGALFRRKFGERVRPSWIPRVLTNEESWMFDQENEIEMFRVSGGVDTFAKAFASHISDSISLHSEVRKITQTSSGALVEYVSDGEIKTQFADYVVSAIPYSVLKDMTFAPTLKSDKAEMISGLEYRPGLLVYFEIPTEYWQTQGLSGFAVTDTVGELWSPGLDFTRDTAITISYTKDEDAQELMALPQEERIATIAKRIEEFLPDFREFIQCSVSLCWDEDRLIRGSRSMAQFLSQDQMALIRRTEGKIHFAGEHTASLRLGWMEGALESAERVASEINAICTSG